MTAVLPPTPDLESIQSKYVVGQTPEVHEVLSLRTAGNSAAFLIPHIKPHYKVLDVGCGPGSITLDFAALVPQGSVVGLDSSPEALETAKGAADGRGLKNVKFVLGMGSKLPL